MALANQNRPINAAALLVAGSFCLLGMAQVARPLRSIGAGSSTAIAAPQQCLTRHAMQEVSPRNLRPRAPHGLRLRAVVPVTPRDALARTSVFVPLWPMENWPAHRRVSHTAEGVPDPA